MECSCAIGAPANEAAAYGADERQWWAGRRRQYEIMSEEAGMSSTRSNDLHVVVEVARVDVAHGRLEAYGWQV